MEDERIKVIKNWPKPKPVCDIQVFLSFANFYYCFIYGFSRIATLLTSMLRMSLTLTTQKLIDVVDKFGEGDYSKNEAKRTSALTKRPTGMDYLSSNYVSHAISNIVSNYAKNITNYLTLDAKRAFDQLCQTFIKAPIF